MPERIDRVPDEETSDDAESSWPPRRGSAGKGVTAALAALDRLDRFDPNETSRFLARRVGEYVRHLAVHVPALRDSIASVRGKGTIGQSVTLASLPMNSRATVRDYVEAHGAIPMPTRHGAAKQGSTSGSSGVPLRFFTSELSNDLSGLLYLHDHVVRQGADLALDANRIRANLPSHEGEHLEFPPQPGELRKGTVRMRSAPDHTVESHASWLRRHPAAYLTVHPRLLAGILDVYAREGGAPTGMRAVLTIGETVDAALRAQAREVLGARIVDRYSCEEIGPIAFQCPHRDDWYHVAIANVVVEVVDEDGRALPPGEPGRVLVTGFNNWATPFLRYELGDVAALHPRCACGAHAPALTRLLGRRRELIRMPNGERRFLRVVASHWLDIAPVREWRLTQREPLALEAELVCASPLTAEQREAIARTLRALTDPAFRVAIIERDAIDWGPSYKRQDFVCLV